MKRTSAALVLLLAAAGCDQQGARVDTMVDVPVGVTEIVPGAIEEYTETTGTVQAARSAELVSETAGDYRPEINPRTGEPYALGDHVAKGTVIVRLDNPEQENSIRIESHKLNLDIARQEYEKQQSLYEKGGVTLRELRTAEKSLIDARYAYDNALIQLDKLTVECPIDGVIVALPTHTVGVRLAAGSPIATVMDYRTLAMETSLPAALLGSVKIGQTIRVRNYAFPDSVLAGRISEVSPALDPDTRTFTAKVVIDNSNWTFRPGMFVKAEIVTARRDNAIVIPRDIILTRRSERIVYVVEEGFARSRRILTGLENPDRVEVVEGLAVDDRLITEGFETLRDGSRVAITR